MLVKTWICCVISAAIAPRVLAEPLSHSTSNASSAQSEKRPASASPKLATPVPLISFVESTEDTGSTKPRILMVTHKKGIAELIARKAEAADKKLLISTLKTAAGSRRVVELLTGALMEEINTQSTPDLSCFLGDAQWDGILRVLSDNSMLSDSKLKSELKKAWKNHDCPQRELAASVPQVSIEEVESDSTSSLTTRSQGRAIDSLAYVMTSIGSEHAILKTSRGDLKVIGTLMSVHYEDPAQSKDENNFASGFREIGADVMMAYQNPKTTLGAGLYTYRYGSSNHVDGKNSAIYDEMYLNYAKKLGESFSVDTRYVWGVSEGEKYEQVRITGSYVPKIWR